MTFAWFVALRFLWDQKLYSALVLTGVGVGVGVIVFLSALIGGLQRDLIAKTLGTQAHVVVSPRTERARPQWTRTDLGAAVLLRRSDLPEQRVRSIDAWQKIVRRISAMPDVTAAAPLCGGAGFATRGHASEAIAIHGVDARSFERIVAVRPAIRAGSFAVDGTSAVIGVELAGKLGIGVGDKFRIQTGDLRGELFTVRGVFDLGNLQVNQRWVLISLRNAQTLLDLVGGASAIYVRVRDLYAATTVADRIADATGLTTDSWMKTNQQLLTALQSQSASSTLIQSFVILAVAIGISSVLAVSVVQRSREIGILRAMGAPTGGVLRAFLLQGALLGVGGSVLGCGLGGALAVAFPRLVARGGTPLFPVELTPALFLFTTALAVATGTLAALLPARRAARLDPAVAIRNV